MMFYSYFWALSRLNGPAKNLQMEWGKEKDETPFKQSPNLRIELVQICGQPN